MTTIYKVAVKTVKGSFPSVSGPLMEAIKARPELVEYLPEPDPEFITQEFDDDDNPIESLWVCRIPRHHPELIAALESIDSKDWQGLEIIELERPEYSLYENEYLIEHLVVPKTEYDARVIPHGEDSPYVYTPLIPVTLLEELLSDFIGDGTSGESFLTTSLQEMIDKARGVVKESKFEWKTIEDFPKLFNSASRQQREDFLGQPYTSPNQLIPQEWLDKAAEPLPEGDYKILLVSHDPGGSGFIGLRLPNEQSFFIWSKDLTGIPEVGGNLRVTSTPVTYTCIPPEKYTLEERIELYREALSNYFIPVKSVSFPNEDVEYQHSLLDRDGIPRVK